MRYYSITLSDPKTGQSLVLDNSGGFTRGTGPTFTSLTKLPMTGKTVADPGALNIEFDFPISTFAAFEGGHRIKIWGVGLRALGQASNLAGFNFSMKGGMSHPGLALANPAQAGILLQGTVFQAYGNWEGVNMTLDLIVNPGGQQNIVGTPIAFHWAAGVSLDEAINDAIAMAFHGVKSEIFIDANLTLAHDEAGYYENFIQFASYLKGITLKLGSQYIANYAGVDIVWNGDVLNIFDGTNTARGPGAVNVQLDFQDLIGQPTWVGGTEVKFNTVLRADIRVGNHITFPTGILAPYALTSPKAAVPNVPAMSKSIFQGEFSVTAIHQFGSFRDPDAGSWVTAFRAATVKSP